MGFLVNAARRAINFARDRRLGQRIGTVLLGGQSPASAGGALAIGVYRKLIAAVVGGVFAFLHVKLGWDIVGFFGDDFEVGLIEALTAYLVWRVPNGTPPPAGATA